MERKNILCSYEIFFFTNFNLVINFVLLKHAPNKTKHNFKCIILYVNVFLFSFMK